MSERRGIKKLRGDKLVCPSRRGEGHCCVIDWGEYNFICPHLVGVYYKGEFYDKNSDEFKKRFDEDEIDNSQLEWACSNPLPTWIRLRKIIKEGKQII
ncbi:MAG: hypothetical protein SVM80_08715 [Halobacteriota archaeon]|nr:hypothetical protein [Halobacteriota archaeon]